MTGAKWCFCCAAGCFLVAFYVDSPLPRWPHPDEKLTGNFMCSAGFFLLALGFVLQ